MSTVLQIIGLAQISTNNLLYLLFALLLGCVLAGWFTDALMGRAGFGVVGNTVLLFVWIFIGLVVYSLYIRQIRTEPALVAIMVGTGSAFGGLILTAALRRLLIK